VQKIVNLDEPVLVMLTPQGFLQIITGLDELPRKVSNPIVEDLRAQVLRALEDPKTHLAALELQVRNLRQKIADKEPKPPSEPTPDPIPDTMELCRAPPEQ
jgi:hypothetical protein